MGVTTASFEPCPGCGALFLSSDGPTHRYIGASAGCWAAHGRLLAGEYPHSLGKLTATVVDAYAAQHPGQDVAPARQSVAIHLVVLHARIHHDVDSAWLNRIRVVSAEWGHANGFEWLEPIPDWRLTMSDVIEANGATARDAVVDQWIQHVYEAWMDGQGARVRVWYDRIIESLHR